MFFEENGRKGGYLAWSKDNSHCHYISENNHAEEGFLFLAKTIVPGGPVLCQVLYKHSHLISTPV